MGYILYWATEWESSPAWGDSFGGKIIREVDLEAYFTWMATHNALKDEKVEYQHGWQECTRWGLPPSAWARRFSSLIPRSRPRLS